MVRIILQMVEKFNQNGEMIKFLKMVTLRYPGKMVKVT